jgi:hypothetical protein
MVVRPQLGFVCGLLLALAINNICFHKHSNTCKILCSILLAQKDVELATLAPLKKRGKYDD